MTIYEFFHFCSLTHTQSGFSVLYATLVWGGTLNFNSWSVSLFLTYPNDQQWPDKQPHHSPNQNTIQIQIQKVYRILL